MLKLAHICSMLTILGLVFGCAGRKVDNDPQTKQGDLAVIGGGQVVDALYTDLGLVSPAEDNGLAWTHAYGGGGPNEDNARGAACFADGRCLVAGEIRAGDVRFHENTTQVDQLNGYLWAIDAEGNAGNPLLIPNTVAVDIDVQTDGNVVFAGTFIGSLTTQQNTVSATQGRRDALVIRIDAQGALLNSLSFGSAGNDAVNEVAVGPSDEILVIGPYGQGADNAALVFPDGSIAAASGGEDDVFLARISSGGSFEWGIALEGTGHEEGRGVAVDSRGNILICGQFDEQLRLGTNMHSSVGDADIFVAKLDAQGTVIWSHSFGGSQYDVCRGIAAGLNDNVVISGEYTDTLVLGEMNLKAHSRTDRDIFVALLDPETGHVDRAITLGSVKTDIGCEIEIIATGEIYCAGSAGAALKFPGGNLPTTGSGEQFLLRFDAALQKVEGFIASTGKAREINFAIGLRPDGSGLIVGRFGNKPSFFGQSALDAPGASATGNNHDFYAAGFEFISAN